jgi:hypothetical protein
VVVVPGPPVVGDQLFALGRHGGQCRAPCIVPITIYNS